MDSYIRRCSTCCNYSNQAVKATVLLIFCGVFVAQTLIRIFFSIFTTFWRRRNTGSGFSFLQDEYFQYDVVVLDSKYYLDTTLWWCSTTLEFRPTKFQQYYCHVFFIHRYYLIKKKLIWTWHTFACSIISSRFWSASSMETAPVCCKYNHH